jgi:hypothetical protein
LRGRPEVAAEVGVRAGPSGALVLRGEARVGKSALLSIWGTTAPGCGIAQAVGAQPF